MKSVLFWSGGKDSYLALSFLRKNGKTDPILLTTYNEENNIVPIQNISLTDIQNQATHLALDLLPVPLPHKCNNEEYVRRITAALSVHSRSVCELIFGDLWIEDIRQWRENVFRTAGFSCLFPLWHIPYEKLLQELWKSPVSIQISSVDPDFKSVISPGQRYDQSFVRNLPDTIDVMGEKGEFHTQAFL